MEPSTFTEPLREQRGDAGGARRSLLTDTDLYLFNEGNHYRLYERLGAHVTSFDGVNGTYFATWAPEAERIAVVGDFNGWNKEATSLSSRGTSGIWEGFVPGVGQGTQYKFHVFSRHLGYRADKADPYGFHHETPSKTASIVWNLDYPWGDGEWLAARARRDPLREPMSVYEVHLGSWMRPDPADGRPFLGYRELAPRLVEHLQRTGFTHVELLPVMEHPFYGSWGYQVTGYFAPTSRYGTPQDFMYLVDYLHRHGFGVLLDWVPSHFPRDEHGIGFFDGSHLYEHADPRQGVHNDWDSLIFNYGRKEVRSFLLSSAHFWIDRFHIDGLRVDAVASMLYLDYSREEGEWVPNPYGGRENLDAISVLRHLNHSLYGEHPGIVTIAEESTAWPMVSRPTDVGGLGFGMKWDMGWMHDTLKYFSKDPIHRKFHHNELTFRTLYAHHENFVLPLSHDEVVHGKRSLLGRMPGDMWQQFANLRLLYGYMYGQPGKKLLFMGGEFGQWREWDHESSLDWHLLDYPTHSGVMSWIADLNRVHRAEPALHELDCHPQGFEWIDCSDVDSGVLAFLRRGESDPRPIAVICNFTPVPRLGYRVGVPWAGLWRELLNSDAGCYGGSNTGNAGAVHTEPVATHGREQSLVLDLPPLAALFLKPAD